MSVVSQAKHQQNSSANNAIAPLNAPEGKNEDVLEGPIGEVLAQSGTTAVLPCKISDPGAGTVSVTQVCITIYIYFSPFIYQCFFRLKIYVYLFIYSLIFLLTKNNCNMTNFLNYLFVSVVECALLKIML